MNATDEREKLIDGALHQADRDGEKFRKFKE